MERKIGLHTFNARCIGLSSISFFLTATIRDTGALLSFYVPGHLRCKSVLWNGLHSVWELRQTFRDSQLLPIVLFLLKPFLSTCRLWKHIVSPKSIKGFFAFTQFYSIFSLHWRQAASWGSSEDSLVNISVSLEKQGNFQGIWLPKQIISYSGMVAGQEHW